MTLYVKVTWPYKWPILSRYLIPIHDKDMIFLVSIVCWVKKVNSMWSRYVTLTRDLVHQGHVTLQVTYIISGPIHTRDLDMIFFVSMVCCIKKVNGMWARYLTLMHDLARQSHMTLQVAFLISGSMHARGMNFFVSMVCWVKKVNGMWVRYVTLMHDLVRQGPVTLQVTYLISGPIHARDMNYFLVPR